MLELRASAAILKSARLGFEGTRGLRDQPLALHVQAARASGFVDSVTRTLVVVILHEQGREVNRGALHADGVASPGTEEALVDRNRNQAAPVWGRSTTRAFWSAASEA